MGLGRRDIVTEYDPRDQLPSAEPQASVHWQLLRHLALFEDDHNQMILACTDVQKYWPNTGSKLSLPIGDRCSDFEAEESVVESMRD